MNSIWYSLIWKEWHEHKWKLAAITAVLWGITGVAFWIAKPIDVLGLTLGLVTACMAPLAVFVGLGAAAGERARGTLPFLQASPVSMRRVAVTKLVAGFLTIGAAIILVEVLIWVCLSLFELNDGEYRGVFRVFDRQSLTGRWYFDCLLFTSAIAASLFIWSAAAGVNRKDEVSAGAWALTTMAGWGLLVFSSFLLLDKYEMRIIPKWLEVVGFATLPGACLTIIEPWAAHYRLLGLGTACGIHGALAVWYVLRFGRIEKIEVRSPQPAIRDAARPGWLAAPRHSALTAIAWKQFRESLPLVLCGMAGVIGISTLFVLGEPRDLLARSDRFAEMSAGVTVVIGFIVAVVTGIGVCLNDSSPGLSTFWRSRPINVDVWFWTKFFTGLGILVAAFYGPLLVVLLALHSDPLKLILTPNAWAAQLAAFAVFATAVMMTCFVRHAVYAAILSMAIVYLELLIVSYVALCVIGLKPYDIQIPFALAMTFLTSTLIAWLAVRYDWGRKGRY